ncbi:hypothetical protein BVX97_00945 [bacterium E08(2017)]|nr:hypothetical protein BVX97_00945 [bacterium E08(2017)]
MKLNSILLLQPRHEKAGQSSRSSFSFPWGIGTLAALFKENGVKVQVIDGQALQLTKEELAAEVDKYDFDCLGISAFSTQFPAVKQLASHVKRQRDLPIIVGGPLATYQPELTLKSCDVDVCVIGPGEISGLEVLKYWGELHNVRGIAYKKNGEIIRTEAQRVFFNLDDTPMPDFSLFQMGKYLNQDNAFARKSNDGSYRSISFVTTRGCPYECNFCSKSSAGFSRMSPAKLGNMLGALKSEFGIEEISFGDELFLSSRKVFSEMLPVLKELSLRWGGQARANLVDKEFLHMIKEGGCIGLGYGIESGSQKILNNMNKRTTVEQNEFAISYTRSIGIPVKVQLIFGYPGEDDQTVRETIEMFDRIDHPGRRFNVITPVPGSPLYEDCIRDGLIIDEESYLYDIEVSFGAPRVHVNFTPWPDDEIYPRKRDAEEMMLDNYASKTVMRRVRRVASKVRKRLRGR